MPSMSITNYWLDQADRDEIKGGSAMNTRRCLVIHFTAGATGASSIESMRDSGVSAHLVIERDGKIWQCRPFNLTAGHAGESTWVDPVTGKTYEGLNSCSIGIEVANAGSDDGALSWARKQPGFDSLFACHRNGGSEKEWEKFYGAQLLSLLSVSSLLVQTYNLDDVTGHDCIAPDRKDDPGPAFPMEQFRELLGFSGLPTVHY